MAFLIFLLTSTISWSRILTPSYSILWLPLDWWHSLITVFVCFWCSVSSPSHFPRNLDVSQRFQAISPLFLGGGGRGSEARPPRKFEISKPLNVISSILGNKFRTKKCGSFFIQENAAFIQLSIYQPHNQFVRPMNNMMKSKFELLPINNFWGTLRDKWSSCGGPLTRKAQTHGGGHRVNFDRNLPSSCFVVQYNSLISMI